jgi:hypothetical protein
VIEHNLIAGNGFGTGSDGAGIKIDSNATAGVTVRNNLIVNNEDQSAIGGGGIHIVGGVVSLQSNTIANNSLTNASALGAGVRVGAGATVTMNDNILAENFNATGAASDIYTSAVLTESYNLTTDGSLADVTDIYANPFFAANWYLQNRSPALNADALQTRASVGYLATNPYTETTIIDTGNLDLGYHHKAPAPVVGATQTTVTAALTTLARFGSTTITVTPRDNLGNLLGSGQRVVLSSTGATSISTVRDHGDGTYTAVFTTQLNAAGSSTISATVNGVAITSAMPIISWP